MTGDHRVGRCWYCAEATLRVDDPPEHIIPESMGGRLTTDRVCRDCNGRAGREIDGPFMRDWLVAMDRALYIADRAKLHPRVDAALEDGTPVDIETGKGAWRARIRASIDYDGDEVRIRASSLAEYHKLLDRVRRQAEADGRTFVEPSEPEVTETDGPVVVSTRVNGVTWLRMAAKVTLGCLSRVMNDDWLDSAEAAKYRGWLWDAKPTNPDGTPALGFPCELNELERYTVRPPEHLIYCGPAGNGRASLGIVFFGSTAVRAAVDLAGQPVPRAGWRTAPGREAIETTFDALLQEAALNYVAVNAEDDDELTDDVE